MLSRLCFIAIIGNAADEERRSEKYSRLIYCEQTIYLFSITLNAISMKKEIELKVSIVHVTYFIWYVRNILDH